MARDPHLQSRRRFVQSVALGGLAAKFGRLAASEPAPVLSGSEFDLSIGSINVDFGGGSRPATVVNGRLPAPLLRWREGDVVTLRVRNTLPTTSSIHWHGILLPASMDGVPGFSFPGIAPGETFTYRFPVRQAGTYWYHSHSRFQEQTGLYGAIVIEPRDGESHYVDRDYVVLLSDWTDLNPERIYATLKKQSNYYNHARPTVAEKWKSGNGMWNRMRMDPSDLADVGGYAYTYLMNGATPASNWTAGFARGDKVRLRFINGSSMTFFDIRIPGLSMKVIAADGQPVESVAVDEFRIGTAETYDVIVEPDVDRAYTIFAQSMDRSGFARGTLTPRVGLTADVPAIDAPQRLRMKDTMGDMSMKGMDSRSGAPSGPGVDMTVPMPRTNLDDPGVGLRDNGRRVLTYADLRSTSPVGDAKPTRSITLHLTGNMERYIWSFDAMKFSDAMPLRFENGERVRITLVNDTMMTHPIHLHGMWSDIENTDGEFQARKHTVVVQPAQTVSYRITAGPNGRWAYHCHLLYHMEAGMFREVVVA
ncbi:MAG TPA: copper resistance system multicopper oxidase [Rudaea sp.]|jgi:FtsP/CotA-like multicopper oxidase with cupredoxin domain|nr:copper resistance system multicopper oxidase [Rudaea sp.]